MPIRRSIALALLAGALLAATASAATVSGSAVAREVQKELSASTGVPVTRVTCPASVAIRKGNSFLCDTTWASGDRVPVRVRLTDAKGSFRAQIVNMLMRHLEAQLVAVLAADDVNGAKVGCPATRKVRKGDKFRCAAVDLSAKTYVFAITQTGKGLARYKRR